MTSKKPKKPTRIGWGRRRGEERPGVKKKLFQTTDRLTDRPTDRATNDREKRTPLARCPSYLSQPPKPSIHWQ
jgi:hypothetical protein